MFRFKLKPREIIILFAPLLFLVLCLIPQGEDPWMVSLPELFSRPRENARRSSCQSNLKGMGMGIKMYCADYDGRYPLEISPAVGWDNLIMPYTKSCPITQCPSETTAPFMGPGRGVGAGCPSDYWINARLNDAAGVGRNERMLPIPSNTILMGDGDGTKGTPNYALDDTSWNAKQPYALRHLKGANYSFCDGHVKWFLARDVDKTKSLAPSKGAPTFLIR